MQPPSAADPQREPPMSEHANPLLSDAPRLPFDRISAEHVRPAVRSVLAGAGEEVRRIGGGEVPPTWANTVAVLDEVTEEVSRRLAPVRHLLAVAETPELREAWNDVLPEVTAFWAGLMLDPRLWGRLRAYAETEDAASLRGLRRRHLDKVLREFRRAGADLPEADRKRVEEIRVRLSTLEQRFGENVLDATATYRLHVTDGERLRGIPDAPRDRFRRRAAEEGLDGWLLTLDFPSYEAVMKHARDRGLREEIHRAYVGRCRGGEHDNRPLIVEILALRRELAALLGYPDFPDYRLEEAMAKNGETALRFVEDLTGRTRPYWERDVDELRAHARDSGIDGLRPWDVAWLAEDLRRARFEIDDEILRPYFPLGRALEGLFEVARRIFGVRVEERRIEEVWHPDVRFYDLVDADGTRLGSFYTDWFPREEKRQGAWMNDFVTGGPEPDGGFRPHLGVICGNFTPPDGDGPALLTHREVQTLFHEFGHLLHHLVSRVPIPGRAGINVAWDFVELPSQLMENWTWERDALDLFARHHETGEALPEELRVRMLRARRFLGGWAQMRQLAFARTDLVLHREYAPDEDGDVLEYVQRVIREYVAEEEFARLHHTTSFTHLFSGGYAAAYYSYLWSEMLEADAFTRFREEGVFSREVGEAYMRAILTRGDSEEPDVLFREFMGRDPDPEALLRKNLGVPEAVRP